jgi:hypothetical protein
VGTPCRYIRPQEYAAGNNSSQPAATPAAQRKKIAHREIWTNAFAEIVAHESATLTFSANSSLN